MSDQSVYNLLRSDEPLVVIEAPAGCGKTFQGANYAHDVAPHLQTGRMLILTHTHAACDVFAERTKGLPGNKVEIRTIDALITQIARAYHKTLDLPADPTAWAYANDGFSEMAARVSCLLSHNRMICAALARRYPIIVCDEHQDASPDHHNIVMAIHANGAKLRIFGDRMQSIYERGVRKAQKHRARWEQLVEDATHDELDTAHRWLRDKRGCPDLGEWVQSARKSLLAGETIDLSTGVPKTVRVLFAENTAPKRDMYQVTWEERKPIERAFKEADQVFVLGASNDLVQGLRQFWNRSVPIWEGHTRSALSRMVSELDACEGDAAGNGAVLIEFMSAVGKGSTQSSHGKILVSEIESGCAKPRSKKPGCIQELAKLILSEPNHQGVARAIAQIHRFMDDQAPGFADIKIDRWKEFIESQRLAAFDEPAIAFAEIHMRNSVIRRKPPAKALSTIHKAKGMECENAIVMNCDRSSFGDTIPGRCKLYVALSRAMSSLTLVLPTSNPSPLFKLA